VVDVVYKEAAGGQQQQQRDPGAPQQQQQGRVVLKLSAQGDLCLKWPRLLPPTAQQVSREAATLQMLRSSSFVAKVSAFVLLVVDVHPDSYGEADQQGSSAARERSRALALDSARKAAERAWHGNCTGYVSVPRDDYATAEQVAGRLPCTRHSWLAMFQLL
jgi:hypothetical protein